MRKIRLALIQQPVPERNPEENLEKTIVLIESAAKNKARIICLQELFLSRYFPREEKKSFFRLAEKIPGPTTSVLQKVAKINGTVLIVPLFEKRASGLYHNSAVVIDADGKLLGVYRKMHIPHDPYFREKYYFSPGDRGFKTFKTAFGVIGVLICWDQWFPEAARLTALAGAEIIFYPTAIGFQSGETKAAVNKQIRAWKTIQVAHAIANGIFVASVNRVGREKNLSFWGHSFVAAPDGSIIARAGSSRGKILVADCDLRLIGHTREEWPFLRDRRIDAYKPLSKLYSGNSA